MAIRSTSLGRRRDKWSHVLRALPREVSKCARRREWRQRFLLSNHDVDGEDLRSLRGSRLGPAPCWPCASALVGVRPRPSAFQPSHALYRPRSMASKPNSAILLVVNQGT